MDEQISAMLKWKRQYVKVQQTQDNTAMCYQKGNRRIWPKTPS